MPRSHIPLTRLTGTSRHPSLLRYGVGAPYKPGRKSGSFFGGESYAPLARNTSNSEGESHAPLAHNISNLKSVAYVPFEIC